MKPKRIKNLDDLMAARNRKQSVTVPTAEAYKHPRPAAFMIHQSGEMLHRLFGYGMFVYERPKKRCVLPWTIKWQKA